jgi:putative transposase
VQLLVTPPAAHSLSSMMQAIGRRYVARYNQRHGRSGTLWEGRFRAALVEADAYFLACQRYIESGLPDEGLASALLDPLYSSLAHHLGKARNPLLTDHAAYWALGNTPFEREHAYRRWLDEGVGEAERARIADAVSYGWALARPEYLARPWAAALDAPLVRRLPGRPRKSPAT